MLQSTLETRPESPITSFHPFLVEITEASHNILLELRYATKNNITGNRIYHDDRCFIHQDALPLLQRSVALAQDQGLKIKVFDAYRPQRTQDALWAFCPNPDYVATPEKGSNHTRGVAIDLTLVDANGQELDMGTPFDDLTPQSHHGAPQVSDRVAANRYLLLGIMMSAGWDFYQKEWWHYQVFKAQGYPLV